MSAQGGEPKEPTSVKLSSLDAYKELKALGIDVIKFFPFLNTFHGEVSINRTEDGALLITAFGSHKFPPDGIRFVYRYEPEKKQSHLVFDVNDGREPNSDLNKILVLQKKITIQEAVDQLSRFLGFKSDETLKKFPRLQNFTRGVLFQFMKYGGKLSIHGYDEKESSFSFIYDYFLASGESKLVYTKEVDPTSGMKKVFAAWSKDTFGNRPPDAKE